MKVNIIFWILFVFFQGVAIGQETASIPLEYEIFLTKLERESKTITVSLVIKNTGDDKIVIDKNLMSYEVVFQKCGKELPDGGITAGKALTITGDVSPNYIGEYLILSPNQSYRRERVFKLKEGFFEKERTFKLFLVYGQFINTQFENLKVWKGTVRSNEINFGL